MDTLIVLPHRIEIHVAVKTLFIKRLTQEYYHAITLPKRYFMHFTSSSLDFSIVPYVEGVNPPVVKPNPKFLSDIGEDGMRELFSRFYTLLFASPIRNIFPLDEEGMQTAAQHSADFFIQICGGTPYFSQKRGAPQMRKRHAPFSITPQARLYWLDTFKKALAPIVLEKQSTEENIQSLWNYINIFSIWMINKKD